MSTRNTVFAIIILVVLVIGVVWVGSRTSNTQDVTASPSPSATTSASSSDGTILSASSVTISNFAFSPSSITVKKGETVTWTNNDSVTHTITSSEGPVGFDSGNVEPGKSFSFGFTEAGSYSYSCTLHPEMIGLIIVTE